ncbi:type II secretion system protein [Roseateles sp. LYH14W]|uniref:Type II secretion system protein n=1 Tax=Pelomonas parva TaxID=3299032 RepID=A0ABW7EYR7_9BURK
MRTGEQGFTYLLLLFAMVIGGIGLAALGEQARQRALREQEAELAFRGAEIARAIASYVQASPAGSRALPASVDALLEDRRSGRIVRHLRQLRADPLGGPAGGDWVWLAPGEHGCSAPPKSGSATPGLSAVRSSSTRALLKRDSKDAKPACDLLFRHEAYLQAAGKPAASSAAVSP